MLGQGLANVGQGFGQRLGNAPATALEDDDRIDASGLTLPRQQQQNEVGKTNKILAKIGKRLAKVGKTNTRRNRESPTRSPAIRLWARIRPGWGGEVLFAAE